MAVWIQYIFSQVYADDLYSYHYHSHGLHTTIDLRNKFKLIQVYTGVYNRTSIPAARPADTGSLFYTGTLTPFSYSKFFQYFDKNFTTGVGDEPVQKHD